MIQAWDNERLIGFARSLSDFTYVTCLADLAVDVEYQKRSIGKQLIEETKRRAKPECMIVSLAAPKANKYYSKPGFEHKPRPWVLSERKAQRRAV